MSVKTEVSAWLPAIVRQVEYNAPFFTLAGADPKWSLSVACPFRIDHPVRGPLNSEAESDDLLESVVMQLRNKRLIDLEVHDDLIDPIFTFSDGTRLMVRADSDFDPWVMHLGNYELNLVGGHTA